MSAITASAIGRIAASGAIALAIVSPTNATNTNGNSVKVSAASIQIALTKEPVHPGTISSETARRLRGLKRFWILPIQLRRPFPETLRVRTGSNRWKNSPASGSNNNGVRSEIPRGRIQSRVRVSPWKIIVGFVGSKLDAPMETDSVCNVCCNWPIMNPNPVKSKQRAQLMAPCVVSFATTRPMTVLQRKK